MYAIAALYALMPVDRLASRQQGYILHLDCSYLKVLVLELGLRYYKLDLSIFACWPLDWFSTWIECPYLALGILFFSFYVYAVNMSAT